MIPQKASVDGSEAENVGKILTHGIVSKLASIRIVALAVIIAGTVWQPLRAGETAKQDTSDHASCARSTFRVVVDAGHTATSPGADSARGVPEYEFNLKLADVIAHRCARQGSTKQSDWSRAGQG